MIEKDKTGTMTRQDMAASDTKSTGVFDEKKTSVSYRESLSHCEQLLREAGIADAAVDAWLLFSAVTRMDRSQYYLHMAESMPEDERADYQALARERCRRIPLQYILGETEFMGLPFWVTPDVLIPRPDTETLVEEALARIRPGMKVLDLCTGSGCIAVSLAKLGTATAEKDIATAAGSAAGAQKAAATAEKITATAEKDTAAAGSAAGAQKAAATAEKITATAEIDIAGKKEQADSRLYVTASDISEAALAVARENARINDVQVSFVQSDLFSDIEGTFDMIVSNPPYIPRHVIEGLEPEVVDHEPHGALDGGVDGLDFYRRIVAGASGHLRAGGWILFEIGYDQSEAVTGLLREAGYEEISCKQDLAHLDRVVVGLRRCIARSNS